MGEEVEALDFFDKKLLDVVCYILDREDLALSLLRPFFERAWDKLRDEVQGTSRRIFNWAGFSLNECDLPDEAYQAHQAALAQSLGGPFLGMVTDLHNLSHSLLHLRQAKLAQETDALALRCAEVF